MLDLLFVFLLFHRLFISRVHTLILLPVFPSCVMLSCSLSRSHFYSKNQEKFAVWFLKRSTMRWCCRFWSEGGESVDILITKITPTSHPSEKQEEGNEEWKRREGNDNKIRWARRKRGGMGWDASWWWDDVWNLHRVKRRLMMKLMEKWNERNRRRRRRKGMEGQTDRQVDHFLWETFKRRRRWFQEEQYFSRSYSSSCFLPSLIFPLPEAKKEIIIRHLLPHPCLALSLSPWSFWFFTSEFLSKQRKRERITFLYTHSPRKPSLCCIHFLPRFLSPSMTQCRTERRVGSEEEDFRGF